MPQIQLISFLAANKETRKTVTDTLEKMALGGINVRLEVNLVDKVFRKIGRYRF